jgi:hypothetical protein
MISASSLTWFVVRLVIIEALLIAPWPPAGGGISGLYRSAFCATGSAISGLLYAEHDVTLSAIRPPQGLLDVDVAVVNPQSGQRGIRGTMPISSRHFGYMPMAFALALSLATPWPWKRRLFGVLVVVLCTGALVMLRLWIAVQVNFSDPAGPRMWDLPPTLRAALASIEGALSVPMIGWFLLPLLIWMTWLAVVPGAGDWRAFSTRRSRSAHINR